MATRGDLTLEKEDLPTEIQEAINKLYSQEFDRHHRARHMIEELEGALGRTVRKVRNEAIVVIDKDTYKRWLELTTIDIFKYLYADMKRRGRPYIKCVRVTYRRIVIWVPTGAYTSGLTTNLFIVATPMAGEPNFFGRRIPAEVGKLQVWRTPKFDVFSFNGSEGDELYKEWVAFVTTDKPSRIRLGLSVKET
jgi:hypothetical protein